MSNQCERCHGSGSIPNGTDKMACGACGGSGMQADASGEIIHAAEGMTLEPGEYEEVGTGMRLTLLSSWQSKKLDSGWWFIEVTRRGPVTAVRRVDPKPAETLCVCLHLRSAHNARGCAEPGCPCGWDGAPVTTIDSVDPKPASEAVAPAAGGAPRMRQLSDKYEPDAGSERGACVNCKRPRHDHYSGPFSEPGELHCSKYGVPTAPPQQPAERIEPSPEWFPQSSTWVSVNGDPPEQVTNGFYEDGVVQLDRGRWVAVNRCKPEPSTEELFYHLSRAITAGVFGIPAEAVPDLQDKLTELKRRFDRREER